MFLIVLSLQFLYTGTIVFKKTKLARKEKRKKEKEREGGINEGRKILFCLSDITLKRN